MTTPRSNLMAALTLLAALCVGAAIGVGVDRSMLHRHTAFPRGGRGSSGPFGMMGDPADTAGRNRYRARIMKRITEELSLSSAQVTAVEAIFVRRERQLDLLRTHVEPRLDSLRDQMRVSIDSVLTPEQRVKFAEARKRMDARRQSGGGRGPGRPD
jgi:hypothetical protein